MHIIHIFIKSETRKCSNVIRTFKMITMAGMTHVFTYLYYIVFKKQNKSGSRTQKSKQTST